MSKDMILDSLIDQQKKLIDQYVGKPLRSIREIMSLIRECCTKHDVVYRENNVNINLLIKMTPEKQREAHDHWEKISQDNQLAILCLLEDEQNGINKLIRSVLLTIAGEKRNTLPTEDHPEDHLAPLSSEKNETLNDALKSIDSALEKGNEENSHLQLLMEHIICQDLISTEKADDCTHELQEAARLFPEKVAEVRSIYSALIDAACEFFSELKSSALSLNTSEEYMHFLVKMHARWKDQEISYQQKSCSSPGLMKFCMQSIILSVTQSLTIARLLKDAERKDLFPLFCKEYQNYNEKNACSNESSEIDKRHDAAVMTWQKTGEYWDQTVQQTLQKIKVHNKKIACDADLLQSMEMIRIGIECLYRTYLAAAHTRIRYNPNDPQEIPPPRPACLIPGFTTVTINKTVFSVEDNGNNGVDKGEQKIDIYTNETIVRRIAYQPCDMPELYIMQTTRNSKDNPVECWMILPHREMCPVGNVIPYSVISGENALPEMQHILSFLHSMKKSSLGELQNIRCVDPDLESKLSQAYESCEKLKIFHDSQIFAVLASDSAARQIFSNLAMFPEEARSAATMIEEMIQQAPGEESPLEKPTIICWMPLQDELPEGYDESSNDAYSGIKEYIFQKKRWSGGEVSLLMKELGITIKYKKKHWKVAGPKGTFPLPSAPLKDHEWRKNLIFAMVQAVCEAETCQNWLNAQEDRE